MKLFLVSRYDELYPDRNDLSVVVAETPEAVIEMLKTSLEEMHGEGQEAMWGNFDVTIKEVSLEEPKIILKMFCAG